MTRWAMHMQGALLGPGYSDEEIELALRSHGAVYEHLEPVALLDRTVELLAPKKSSAGFKAGWNSGRARLGNRSILGDARSPRMQSVMNLKVKFRESFRPFAPVVRRERVADYFELDVGVALHVAGRARSRSVGAQPLPPGVRGFALLKEKRSTLPAITHVDYSARIQTVTKRATPCFTRCYCGLNRPPAVGFWSTPPSTSAASPSFARPTMRIVVS